MEIKNEYPPNIEEIDKALASKSKRGVLYAWSPDIFNPDGVDIPVWLIEHEKIHFVQQKGDPETWWKLYLAEPQFRFEQELEAHKKEYQVFCETSWQNDPLLAKQISKHDFPRFARTRAERRMYLKSICKRLSGPLYGNLTNEKKVKDLIVSN